MVLRCQVIPAALLLLNRHCPFRSPRGALAPTKANSNTTAALMRSATADIRPNVIFRNTRAFCCSS